MSISVDEAVEIIKAVGTAVSAILGAGGLAYARIAAKRSKQAAQQTSTTQHIDGQVVTRTSAESAELALYVTGQLVEQVKQIRTELGQIPGNGKRRAAPPEEEP